MQLRFMLAATLLGASFAGGLWAARNAAALGTPLLTTTHGGYTLALANNASFYREVDDQPWGTVWNADQLHRWQSEMEAEMRHEDVPPRTEVERDAWWKARALRTIAEQPDQFVRSVGLRCGRFWNVVPQAGGESVSRGVLTLVALWYATTFLLAVYGLVKWFRRRSLLGGLALSLVVGFCLTHAVYWSNARMRAPLVPALAVLVAMACLRRNPAPGRRE